MKKFLNTLVLVLIITSFPGCMTNVQEGGIRPVIPEGIPDLTKGEGPSPEEAKGSWYLHCGRSRGWAWRDKTGKCDQARQILVTEVPNDCPARNKLREGDVILGVNGKYFSRMPIYEFRDTSKIAQKAEGKFNLILWRKGWDKERIVEVDLSFKPLDFTKGDKPSSSSDWNLGPTGARGWIPARYCESYGARQILITNIDKGSPADGILQKGDVILGLNGKNFDSDARRAFGRAITAAETKAGEGKLSLRRWRDGETEDVIVKIPVMGSYSNTTPWNCEKSKKILENSVKYLLRKDILNKGNKGRPTEKTFAALALLSTGKKEHLQLVKRFIYGFIDQVDEAEKAGKKLPNWGYSAWGWGYYNLLLTEYYLLTKDPKVLPVIRKYSKALAEGQSGVGSWGHGMSMPNHGRLTGYGAMNQAGTICWMSLILAEKCGITSPEIKQAIVRGKVYLDHFIDRQNVPYGDNIIVRNPLLHDDNGKSSAAAAAYSILDDRPGTDFFSKMTVASWAVREFGHTGNIWSMLWGPLGAQRAGNNACSAFLHQQSWYFDLERRWDGGFTYAGKMGYGSNFDYETGITLGSSENQYSGWDTTGSRILMYTLPLKLLAISGKDTLVVPCDDDEVAALIEDGRPVPASIAYRSGDIKYLKDKFVEKTPEELFNLLKSWSPVVRQQAAVSLAARDIDFSKELGPMLKSQNRFERYGACMAIRLQGEKCANLAKKLIPLLDTQDETQFAYTAFALSATKDKEGVNELLEMAIKNYPNDPNDYRLRIIALSLFDKGSVLSESLYGVDRKLLIPAVARIMKCKGGKARDITARSVLQKLDFDELSELWPTLFYSLNNYPLTEIQTGTAGQLEIAATISKHKVEEGMQLIFNHLKQQKRHGSEKRHYEILSLLTSYGVNAKIMLPELESLLATAKKEENRSLHFYKNMIPNLEAAIKQIKESKEIPKMRSIAPYLKAEK